MKRVRQNKGQEYSTYNKKLKEHQLNWSHLRRNCLLKHVVERKKEGRIDRDAKKRKKK
jgi:hypothetical protein